MSEPPTHSPGQLDLVPDDLDAQHAAAAAELKRLEALRMEHTLRAVSRLVGAAGDWRSASAELDQAVAEARAAGATWQQVADAVGITRQSAWSRWADGGHE